MIARLKLSSLATVAVVAIGLGASDVRADGPVPWDVAAGLDRDNPKPGVLLGAIVILRWLIKRPRG